MSPTATSKNARACTAKESEMSRMSDLYTDMQEMLERGSSVEDVSDFFNVPVEWVQEALAGLMQDLEDDLYDGEPSEAQEWADYDPDC